MALTLSLSLALGGCGSDDQSSLPKSTATTDAAAADKAAALDAFNRYWAEQVTIANSGKVPKDAFETTAIGTVREQDIARLQQDAENGTTRKGKPAFKDQTVTLQGDTALVVTCINSDEWVFVPKDGPELAPDNGWDQLGRELKKVDGNWLVTGFSTTSTKETCG